MKKEDKSLMYAVGTLMTRSNVLVKDTSLTKFTFKITGSSDTREFAQVLERSFGVEDIDSIVKSRCPFTPVKVPLDDYGVYLEIDFGTELEHISTFTARAKSATFRHQIKDAGSGVEDILNCTIELLKNEDDEDGKVGSKLKFKEIDPQTGKKVLVPMKIELWKLDSNPVVLTEIDAEQGAEEL